MRQLSIKILILIVLSGLSMPTYSAVKGGIEYSIPIDYQNLSESELLQRADKFFYKSVQYNDGIVSDDITKALTLYNILQNVNPENPKYCIRSGILYDKIQKDRHAKGNFFKAIGINQNNPEPYYYLGEYYYKRELYRKALKNYTQAYDYGMKNNADLFCKIGDIYEKLGDTRSALKYLNYAVKQNPHQELEDKIKKINVINNSEYYSNTKIQLK